MASRKAGGVDLLVDGSNLAQRPLSARELKKLQRNGSHDVLVDWSGDRPVLFVRGVEQGQYSPTQGEWLCRMLRAGEAGHPMGDKPRLLQYALKPLNEAGVTDPFGRGATRRYRLRRGKSWRIVSRSDMPARTDYATENVLVHVRSTYPAAHPFSGMFGSEESVLGWIAHVEVENGNAAPAVIERFALRGPNRPVLAHAEPWRALSWRPHRFIKAWMLRLAPGEVVEGELFFEVDAPPKKWRIDAVSPNVSASATK